MKKGYLFRFTGYIKRSALLYRIVATILFSLFTFSLSAQLIITNSTTQTIDFSNTMQTSVGTNPSTAFAGTGFSSNPTVAGRLNSQAWASTGMSDGDLLFGTSNAITTAGDYARGATSAPETTGGFWAYTGTPHSTANPALMIQPGGSDFVAPGTLTLRILNSGATIISQLALSYNLYVRNDQSRSSYFNVSYSSNDTGYTALPLLDYTTPAAPDALNWVSAGFKSTNITGISIPPGTYFYIRWTSGDAGGSGSRDEIGLDDISLTATYSAPCTQPATQATVTSFTGVLSSQLTLNYTRGTGTGGVLIVARPNPTLTANPVSGITYAGNPNYGNGSALGGGYVVYRGPAAGASTPSSVTVTGLLPSTTYYFFLFEYDVSLPCYKTPSNSGSQLTATGSATNPRDWFRSRISGNWNNAATWESSNVSATGPWITATIKPGLAARGIVILNTVTITADETASRLTIAAAGTLTYLNTATGGDTLSIVDSSGTDFNIIGIYELYGIQPNLATGATGEVSAGGIVRVMGNAGNNSSDDFARSAQMLFRNNAVYDWNINLSFETTLRTYFPTAINTELPVFRVSKSTSVGSNSFTTINGILEVNGTTTTVSFLNTGAKTFRNGIIGNGTLNQNSACEFIIDGLTAQIGGTGIINLNAAGRLRIASSSVTTLISGKVINIGPVTVDGTLLTSINIISGSSSFALSAAGTLGLGSPDGITTGALGNIQVTGTRTFDAAGNYLYNSSAANQSTGNALPATITGSLTISNTAAAGNNTVTLTTNNTTVTTFNLAAGLFAAGTLQNLRIASGGTVNRTGTLGGGNQSQAATAGIIYFVGAGTINPGVGLSLTNVELHGAVSMGGGNTSIKGVLNIGSGSYVIAGTAPTYSSSPASTLLYSCNCDYGANEEWYQNNFGTGPGVPHHVTLAAGTSLNFGASNDAREMRGDLTINNGSIFRLSTTGGTSDFNIMGNWTRNAGGSFVHNNKAVRFNGTAGNQVITVLAAGNTETFAYLLINKASAQSLVLGTGTNVTVNGNSGGYSLQLLSGNLDLNQRTFNFTSYFNANQNNLGIDGTAGNLTRNIISTGGPGTFAVYNPNNVTRFITITRMSGNASLLVFGPTVTVTTAGVGAGGGGINFGNNLCTINGTLQINAYGYVTGFAPSYGINSYLIYNSAGNFDRNVEWGNLSGAGYPYHVTVQNNTMLNLNTTVNGSANRAMAGNLWIKSGSGVVLTTNASSNTLSVAGNLLLEGSLTLPAVYGADLYVGGNWTRTGTFTPNERAVFFYGAGNSTITATGGQLFPYLYLTKTATANTLGLLDDIRISREFSVITGTFELAAKNATLLSTADTTASFGQMGAGGAVSYSSTGRFIVERYIPTGTIAGHHIKSWQFLAVPDNGGQTINSAWQEGYTLPVIGTTGLGTIISSNTPGAGFDIIGGAGPSMKSFDPVTGTWTGVANTATLPIYNQKGYFLFVRGDRNVELYNELPNKTTLRTTGNLFVPGTNPPPSTTVLPGKFASIGNPYASAINFMNISRPAAPALDSTFYVWDPLLPGSYNLGGFQTISSINGYKPNPGGTANYSNAAPYTTIQSGQAFMVHATGAGGVISFSENAKVGGSKTLFRPSFPVTGTRHYLRSQLYTAAGQIADANVLAFDDSFSDEYESGDALKIMNEGENFGILSNEKILSVEARKTLRKTDTIYYNIGRLRVQGYQLRFGPENFSMPGVRAYLLDKFLRSSTPVSLRDSTFVDFSVTVDPASKAADRFRIVFITPEIPREQTSASETKKTITVQEPDIKSGISIYPNPVADNIIRLRFRNQEKGNYTIRLMSLNGQQIFQQEAEVNTPYLEKAIHVADVASGIYNLMIISPTGLNTIEQVMLK